MLLQKKVACENSNPNLSSSPSRDITCQSGVPADLEYRSRGFLPLVSPYLEEAIYYPKEMF